MKHDKRFRVVALALATALLAISLAGAALAGQSNYGRLWHRLSDVEKEFLLIGYAKGLKSAEVTMNQALWNEHFCDQATRRRLIELAGGLSAGLDTTEDLRAVIECLDAFYAASENECIDWASLVGVARSKLDGASEEKIDSELAQLRQCAEHLEELRELHEGR